MSGRHEPVRIVGLVGSYRRGSLNGILLRTAIEEAPLGVEIEPFDLRGVPFFDADLEAAGDPPAVRRLKQVIAEADGLLIATPEYNRGMPARIKNAIDWASRPPGGSVIMGKPVALMGASPGRSGAAHAIADARATLEYVRARVLPSEVAVPRAHTLMEEGRLADPATRRSVRQLVDGLAASVRDEAHAA
jgi:chromate reductase, NAD(P)H dehydrogenase (quinone)